VRLEGKDFSELLNNGDELLLGTESGEVLVVQSEEQVVGEGGEQQCLRHGELGFHLLDVDGNEHERHDDEGEVGVEGEPEGVREVDTVELFLLLHSHVLDLVDVHLFKALSFDRSDARDHLRHQLLLFVGEGGFSRLSETLLSGGKVLEDYLDKVTNTQNAHGPGAAFLRLLSQNQERNHVDQRDGHEKRSQRQALLEHEQVR